MISLVIVVIVLLIMFHVRKSKRAYVVGVKSSYIYKCKSCSGNNTFCHIVYVVWYIYAIKSSTCIFD